MGALLWTRSSASFFLEVSFVLWTGMFWEVCFLLLFVSQKTFPSFPSEAHVWSLGAWGWLPFFHPGFPGWELGLGHLSPLQGLHAKPSPLCG